MINPVLLMCLCWLALCHGHSIRKGIVSTEPSTLKELEGKLNLIIDNEAREQELLEDFLLKKLSSSGLERTRMASSASKLANEPAGSQETSGGNDESTGILPSAHSTAEKETKEDRWGNRNDDDAVKNPEDSWLIVKKLEENSKRMETMVVFLADLRNVLSQAVASQQNQVALRGEVVELREEIEYLRQEVEKVRKDERPSHEPTLSSKLDNKIHNDETTIAWLKESVEELRHGMEEISSSVNVTGMTHLKQQWNSELSRVHGDVKSLRTDLDAIKATQARQLESSVEMRGDIADMRTWQIKMGQKFLQEEQEKVIQNEDMQLSLSLEKASKSEDNETIKKPLSLEATEKGGKRRVTRAHARRHERKLKSELTGLEKMIRDVMRDDALLHKRLVKLEKKFAASNNKEEDAFNSIYIMSEEPARGGGLYDRKNKPKTTAISSVYRIKALEKSLSDYANTLADVNDKVDSLAHLRESSTQLFTALEALESKYDERLTEMQTGLSRMEASVSKASIINDELSEQQNLQSKMVQTLKKDFLATRDQVNTNHLRLAAVQSQLLKWGGQTCTDLSKESIQNIKIASLEARLQALISST